MGYVSLRNIHLLQHGSSEGCCCAVEHFLLFLSPWCSLCCSSLFCSLLLSPPSPFCPFLNNFSQRHPQRGWGAQRSPVVRPLEAALSSMRQPLASPHRGQPLLLWHLHPKQLRTFSFLWVDTWIIWSTATPSSSFGLGRQSKGISCNLRQKVLKLRAVGCKFLHVRPFFSARNPWRGLKCSKSNCPSLKKSCKTKKWWRSNPAKRQIASKRQSSGGQSAPDLGGYFLFYPTPVLQICSCHYAFDCVL